MELKASYMVIKSQFQRIVSNSPCGVERFLPEKPVFSRFFVSNSPCGVESFNDDVLIPSSLATFLIHRVELKVGKMDMFITILNIQVSNSPCGVERKKATQLLFWIYQTCF